MPPYSVVKTRFCHTVYHYVFVPIGLISLLRSKANESLLLPQGVLTPEFLTCFRFSSKNISQSESLPFYKRKSILRFFKSIPKNLPLKLLTASEGAGRRITFGKKFQITQKIRPQNSLRHQRGTPPLRKIQTKEELKMQSQPETRPARKMPSDEDIHDFLIIISVIAKRLASLILKEGEKQNE